MKVRFRKISPRHYRKGRGWSKGFIVADVDGHEVAFREAYGWDCRCPDMECLHIDAVADLIDEATLARIEAGSAWTATGEGG